MKGLGSYLDKVSAQSMLSAIVITTSNYVSRTGDRCVRIYAPQQLSLPISEEPRSEKMERDPGRLTEQQSDQGSSLIRKPSSAPIQQHAGFYKGAVNSVRMTDSAPLQQNKHNNETTE